MCWVIPWGKIPTSQKGNLLAFITEMPRLGFALLLVMIPGMLLYLLLKPADQKNKSRWGIIPIGLVFSTTLISVIGLFSRLLGLSFVLVKAIFCVVGLIEIFLVAKKYPELRLEPKKWLTQIRAALNNPPLVLALILATLMTVHAYLFFIDDTTYLAYLTNWQSSPQLGFENLVHEIQTPELSRFWLAMLPMSQAILADLSGLPGLLLLGNYLEIWLVPLAAITLYWFALEFGWSRKAAGFAVLFQVTLYAWMLGEELPVGLWFYQHLAEDKVIGTFVFAPVFFIFSLDLLKSQSKSRWILFMITGFGLTLTHPVILFYCASIMLLICVFALLARATSWRRVIQIGLSLVFFMSPYPFVRIVDQQQSSQMLYYDAVGASTTFQVEKFINIISDRFYGLNPGVLKLINLEINDQGFNDFYQLVRVLPVVIVLIAGVISWKNYKKNPLYWYILSCIILIVLATVPYTGWILGKFVTARLISRSSWFSPLGLSTVLVLSAIRGWVRSSSLFSSRKSSQRRNKFSASFWGMVACVVLISPVLGSVIFMQLPSYFELLHHNKQLARVGSYIDETTSGPVMTIGIDEKDSLFLPGVSANVRLISFREETLFTLHNTFLTPEENQQRIDASRIIRSADDDYPNEERCFWMSNYGLEYVLVNRDDSQAFEQRVESCQNPLVQVFGTEDLVLLKFSQAW